MRTMHLFAGAGGGLLADLILGHQPVVAVEWEPYACQVLRERAADGWFPGLRVWEGDVRLFDPSEYAGSVDCIHAGFPCQDISLAGKQAGVEDGTRSGLYREVLRIAGIVRPRFLFLENVSAILSNGLGTVLADLAALGYDTRWTCLRASDVGANHQRDRWWALATMADPDKPTGETRRGYGLGEGKQAEAPACDGGDVADSISKRPATRAPDGTRRTLHDQQRISSPNECGRKELEPWPAGCGEELADAHSQRCEEPDPAAIADQSRQHSGRASAGRTSGWWEAEPDVGGMVNEFSAWFHENIMNNPINHCKMTTSLMECCHETKTGRTEVLRILRNGDVTKEIRQSSGRLLSVYETALLLAELCKHKNDTDKARVFMESAETLKTELRGMWLRKEIAGASHRPGQDQQRTRQHPDAMQTLPRLLAHAGEALGECCGGEDATATWWQVEPNTPRVADGVPARVHRLKALGNAQVPLQAAVAWRLLGGD